MACIYRCKYMSAANQYAKLREVPRKKQDSSTHFLPWPRGVGSLQTRALHLLVAPRRRKCYGLSSPVDMCVEQFSDAWKKAALEERTGRGEMCASRGKIEGPEGRRQKGNETEGSSGSRR